MGGNNESGLETSDQAMAYAASNYGYYQSTSPFMYTDDLGEAANPDETGSLADLIIPGKNLIELNKEGISANMATLIGISEYKPFVFYNNTEGIDLRPQTFKDMKDNFEKTTATYLLDTQMLLRETMAKNYNLIITKLTGVDFLKLSKDLDVFFNNHEDVDAPRWMGEPQPPPSDVAPAGTTPAHLSPEVITTTEDMGDMLMYGPQYPPPSEWT